MKQVIRKGLKHIIVDEVPDPVLLPNHVLIRSLYSLISSGTETASIHQEGVLKAVSENPSYLNKIWNAVKSVGPTQTLQEVIAKFKEYSVLGYSGAGIVIDKHPAVTDFEIGDRVAYGGEGTGHAETILAGRNLVVKVPDCVPIQHACFATLGSIALNAVRNASIGLGDVVTVIGLGIIGQLIAQVARLQGGVVVAVDTNPHRVELAHQLGADYAFPDGSMVEDQINSVTDGRGADCVIVAAASKSSAPCLRALRICKDRGRLIIVGSVKLDFPWHEMYLKEIQLFMSRAYGPGSYDPAYERLAIDYPISYVRWTENRNMEEFLRLLSRGRMEVRPLVTHEFPLEEAMKAYQTILEPSLNSLAILLRYPAATSFQQPEPFKLNRRVEIAAHSPKQQDIQAALVGAGNIARWAHLPNLKRIDKVRLRAVCSASGARGKSLALRFGADYCCSDYGEILKDPEIDVVIIATRNQHHFTQALAALRADKHVFLEKPMALTEEECRLLYQAVEETGKHLTVGFNRRFAPFYLDQKKALDRRTGPAVINCRVNSPAISGSYWMADPSLGGAVIGEACHFVDLMYWLLGSEPLSVSAYCLPTGKKHPIGENNLVASFLFEDGSIGNLTYCTVGNNSSGGERVEAFSQGLAIIVEDFKRLESYGLLMRRRSKRWPDKGYKAQMESFLAGVRNNESPKVTARDGARATLCCLRMLESARNLQPCAIDLEVLLSEE